MGIKTLLNRSNGFVQRSGTPVQQWAYCLALWARLQAELMALFARQSLPTVFLREKDARYGAMNPEHWNWRRLPLDMAARAVRAWQDGETPRALAPDDAIRIRHGKHMPKVSSHCEPTVGRHVMGQQF